MKKFLLGILGLCSSWFAVQADAPEGYYDSLNGKCGADLMKAVSELALSKPKVTISYGSKTWTAFKKTDVLKESNTEYWWDMYADMKVKISKGHTGLNIEHCVPNSWWNKVQNDAYKDLCHLNPSEIVANREKGNLPLGEVKKATYQNGVSKVGTPKSGQGGGSAKVYEPADKYKGDYAREYMYVFAVYYNMKTWKKDCAWMYTCTSSKASLQDWASNLLIKWSNNDPVSDKEKKRNDAIQATQKNRNPFIDLPELADHIWGSKKNVPFSVNGNTQPNEPEPQTNPDLGSDALTMSWLGESDSSMGQWTIEDIKHPAEVTGAIWQWKGSGNAHYVNATAYVNNTPYKTESRLWSPTVSLVGMEAATLTFQHAARFQTNCQSQCKVIVKDVESGSLTYIKIQQWPAAGAWNYATATVDLSKFVGKKIKVGFKYGSSTTSADTWRIKNVTVACKAKSQDYDWLGESDTTMGDWYIEDITHPAEVTGDIWQWTKTSGKYYAKAAARVNDTPYKTKSQIWSPEVYLSSASRVTLTFDHAARYQENAQSKCKVVVKDVASGKVKYIKIDTWPAAGNWNFKEASVDLSDFAGKKVRVGFNYESTTVAADTWEVKNVKLSVGKSGTLAPQKELTMNTYIWLDEEDLNIGEWTFEDVVHPTTVEKDLWQWGGSGNSHYLKGSASVKGGSYKTTAYAWSPEVSFDGLQSATLTFQHAAKYQNNCKQTCQVIVKDLDTNEITFINVPQWPAAGTWDFADSGEIDLTAFAGKRVKIGFKYHSTDNYTDTWQIKNVNLEVEQYEFFDIDRNFLQESISESALTTYTWWLGEEDEDMGEWELENVVYPSDKTDHIWVWSGSGDNHYLKGSAYISGKAYDAEAYAWSPELCLEGIQSITLWFEHAARFQTTGPDLCQVAVKDVDNNEIEFFNVPTWPETGTWNFANSGNITLSHLSGKNVKVGFKYGSDTTGADTWEVKNVELASKLKGLNVMTGVEEVIADPETVDDSFDVKLCGNVIYAPEGARIFDLNGREFHSGTPLNRGIYIVVKPTFKKAVKLMVR